MSTNLIASSQIEYKISLLVILWQVGGSPVWNYENRTVFVRNVYLYKSQEKDER